MTPPFCYHAFGLDFQSAIEIPEMRHGHAGTGAPVTIQLTQAPCPDGLLEVVAGVAAGPLDFWMEVPGVARLLVTQGTLISLDLVNECALGDVRAYLLGSALGALLHQRGYLPLHASAVEIDGVAVAFCGASGAGKSTIAHALIKRGHRLICDDIAAVDTRGAAPMLWPGLTMVKLWGESITAAGEQSIGLRPVLAELDKYLRPVEDLAAYHAHPLGHIIILAIADSGRPVMTPLRGSIGAGSLVANSFRGQLVEPMARAHAHFEQCARLANAAQIWTLARPWSHQFMSATCAAVEAAIRRS